MIIGRPSASEYAPFYEGYVQHVGEEDVLHALERQPADYRAALTSVPDSRAGFRYAPGKWSVREVVGHVIDTERVFGFRAMSIARGEKGRLPGFEQEDYVTNGGHERYALPDLVVEFEALRRSHVSMLKHLDPAAWTRVGTANELAISVRALAFIMVGHARHHLATLRSHYGVGTP
jgi:hypothetical protein